MHFIHLHFIYILMWKHSMRNSHFLSILAPEMKCTKIKHLIVGALMIGLVQQTNGQNLIATGTSVYTVEKIVRDFLFNSNKDVTIKNIKYKGGFGAIGAYDAIGTSFGTTTGMILSTGSIYRVNGPYINDTTSTAWTLVPDQDAEVLANGGNPISPPLPPDPPAPPLTTDPAVIEFDVATAGNGLVFNFQFGSDEYADTLYTDTTQDMPRDIFGIMIQGKGVGDGYNYVNFGTVTEYPVPPPIPPPDPLLPFEIPINSYSVNNGPKNQGPCQRCDMFYENFSKGGAYNFTSMAGFTGVFSKSVNVIPCDTYHVKIFIADRKDQLKDSHLFINIDTKNPPLYEVLDKYKIGVASYPVDTVAFEGCDHAEIRVERYTNIGTPGSTTLTYTGTAIPGVDYESLPSVVNFAPNQRVAVIPLIAKKTASGNPDRTVIVNSSNEICGKIRTYTKNYFLRKDLLKINLGPDTNLCEGDKMILNATNTPPAEYYVWNDASSGPVKSVTTTGLYSVRARIGTCLRSDTVSVYFKPLVKFTLGPDSSICFKDSLKLDPKLNLADTAIKYNWYDNTNKPTKTVGSSGTYWLRVSRLGCHNYDTMQLTVKPLPIVDIGKDTTFCYLGIPGYTIDATTDPTNTILWSTGSNNLSIKVTQSGTYTAKVTGNGCNNYDTIKVNMNQTPPVNLRDTLLCENYLLKLRAPKGFAYLWSNGSTDSVISVYNSGQYSVIAMNGSCIAYDTSNVSRKPSPKINLGNDTALCKGQGVLLDATYNGDIVTTLWGGAGNGCGNETKCQTISSGNYYVTLTSQTNGCIAKDTFFFYAKPLPAPNLGIDTAICFYQSATIAPNCPFDSLFWYDGLPVPVSTASTFTYTKPGTYWVKVYRDNCSNVDSLKVKLSVNSPPFTLNHDTGFCKGKSVIYDVSCTNCTYLWNDNSILPMKTFKSSGTHIVTIDNQLCKRIDTITVEAVIPASVFPSDTFVCNGKSLLLVNPIPGASIHWYDNSISNSKIILNPGKYWLTISQKGCKYNDTIQVEYVGGPVVDLGPDVVTCSSEKLFLDVTNRGNTIYEWSNGANTPIIRVDSGGLYKVNVTRCGITESAQVDIDYLSKEMQLFIPNAFTPDANGLNDVLVPGGKIKEPTTYQFSIYNQWGQKVFESNDISKGWDGTHNGVKQPGGVYIWTIDANSDCYAEPYYHAAGNVTLLK